MSRKYETLSEIMVWISDNEAVCVSAYRLENSEDAPRVSIRKYIKTEKYTGHTRYAASFNVEYLDEIEQALKAVNEDLQRQGF